MEIQGLIEVESDPAKRKKLQKLMTNEIKCIETNSKSRELSKIKSELVA